MSDVLIPPEEPNPASPTMLGSYRVSDGAGASPLCLDISSWYTDLPHVPYSAAGNSFGSGISAGYVNLVQPPEDLIIYNIDDPSVVGQEIEFVVNGSHTGSSPDFNLPQSPALSSVSSSNRGKDRGEIRDNGTMSTPTVIMSPVGSDANVGGSQSESPGIENRLTSGLMSQEDSERASVDSNCNDEGENPEVDIGPNRVQGGHAGISSDVAEEPESVHRPKIGVDPQHIRWVNFTGAIPQPIHQSGVYRVHPEPTRWGNFMGPVPGAQNYRDAPPTGNSCPNLFPSGIDCTFPGCIRRLKTQSTYNTHLMRVHGVNGGKKIRCSECSKLFFTKSELKRHQSSSHKIVREATTTPHSTAERLRPSSTLVRNPVWTGRRRRAQRRAKKTSVPPITTLEFFKLEEGVPEIVEITEIKRELPSSEWFHDCEM